MLHVLSRLPVTLSFARHHVWNTCEHLRRTSSRVLNFDTSCKPHWSQFLLFYKKPLLSAE